MINLKGLIACILISLASFRLTKLHFYFLSQFLDVGGALLTSQRNRIITLTGITLLSSLVNTVLKTEQLQLWRALINLIVKVGTLLLHKHDRPSALFLRFLDAGHTLGLIDCVAILLETLNVLDSLHTSALPNLVAIFDISLANSVIFELLNFA